MEPRSEFGLSCLFRLRNLDSKRPLMFWLVCWVLQHSNSRKPRQMVTWITARQVWLSWYFPCDKAEECRAIWWSIVEGPSAAAWDVSTSTGKWHAAALTLGMSGKGGEAEASWHHQRSWSPVCSDGRVQQYGDLLPYRFGKGWRRSKGWGWRVVRSGTKSNWRPVTSSAVLWSTLSPVFFNIFSNDLSEEAECTFHKFAGDSNEEGVADSPEGHAAKSYSWGGQPQATVHAGSLLAEKWVCRKGYVGSWCQYYA